MAATLTDLINYLGASEEHSSLLSSALSDATTLLMAYVEDAAVPENIMDRCTLIVGADLFERRNAPNGIINQQFQSYDGVGQSSARIAHDPLSGVYSMLSRWVVPW